MPRKSSNLLKRRLKIAEIVRKQGEIRVESLCEQLGVSGVTIRGDLAYLEQQGYLKTFVWRSHFHRRRHRVADCLAAGRRSTQPCS